MELAEVLLILGVALCAAAMALWVFASGRSARQSAHSADADPISFMFDGGVLHHATHKALKTFAFFPGTHVWDDLRNALLPRFPDFPERAASGAAGRMLIQSRDPIDTATVELNWRSDLCWVDLSEEPREPEAADADQIAQQICCASMQQPAWEILADGTVGWRNAAYRELSKLVGAADEQPLFQTPDDGEPQRQSLETRSGEKHWFEIIRHDQRGRSMFHATSVTDLVNAEEAQRAFVQTLAKTFAQLSIGLAIFDRNGQLTIFNPALVELTGLPPSFLATQPPILTFFHELRENRRMPEPKDYGTWRQEITNLIAAAAGGNYRETWNLEDGRTYVLQGRPHPDGATAFMLEDISSEVTLSRNYRIELEQYEALLDNIDDAIAVFSSSGVLTFCNAPYRTFWGQNPEAAFADVTILDAIDVWQKQTKSGADWKTVADTVGTLGHRDICNMELRLTDGSRMMCHMLPIVSNATVFRFARPQTLATTRAHS